MKNSCLIHFLDHCYTQNAANFVCRGALIDRLAIGLAPIKEEIMLLAVLGHCSQ